MESSWWIGELCLPEIDLTNAVQRDNFLVAISGPICRTRDANSKEYLLHQIRDTVVQDANDTTPTSQTPLKSSKSRLFSRSAFDTTKTVQQIMMVFDDDNMFNEWLMTVQEEIEVIGEMDHLPHSDQVPDLPPGIPFQHTETSLSPVAPSVPLQPRAGHSEV